MRPKEVRFKYQLPTIVINGQQKYKKFHDQDVAAQWCRNIGKSSLIEKLELIKWEDLEND